MSKKIDAQKVWDAQISCLQQLESNIILLEKATQELKQKVQNRKLEHNYSTNEDCLTYAMRVWRSCLRLHELKSLQWDLEGRDRLGRKNQNVKKPASEKTATESKKKNKGKKK